MPRIERSPFAPARPAQAADVPQIAALYAAHFSGPWPENDWYRLMGREPEADAHETSLFVIDQITDGHEAPPLAGFLLARRVFDEAEIIALAVAPACRQQGVGAELLDHLLAELGDERSCRLFLEVAVENMPALALYEKFGFIEVATRKRYYAVSGRAPVDAKILALDVDDRR